MCFVLFVVCVCVVARIGACLSGLTWEHKGIETVEKLKRGSRRRYRHIEMRESQHAHTGCAAGTGPFSPPKTPIGPRVGLPFSVGMGFLWEVREIEISMRKPDFEPLSWFEPSFLGVKKHQSVSIRKTS